MRIPFMTRTSWIAFVDQSFLLGTPRRMRLSVGSQRSELCPAENQTLVRHNDRAGSASQAPPSPWAYAWLNHPQVAHRC